jgi:Domain of unknown function (DUF2017)
MARPFRRGMGGRVKVALSAEEFGLLRSLPAQLRTVLADGDDPATERLFPPAYTDPADAEAAAEYRRLMQDELAATKLAAADTVAATLDRGVLRGDRWSVELTEAEALAWLGLLNDVRLTLGVRLDVTDDLDGEVDDDDPRAPGLRVLYYLGWLEEHLLATLKP